MKKDFGSGDLDDLRAWIVNKIQTANEARNDCEENDPYRLECKGYRDAMRETYELLRPFKG